MSSRTRAAATASAPEISITNQGGAVTGIGKVERQPAAATALGHGEIAREKLALAAARAFALEAGGEGRKIREIRLIGERLSFMTRGGAGGPPDINAGEKEKPDHVDEMPVPGGGLEAEVLVGPEMAGKSAEKADDEENRADDDVESVEARRHEEGRAIDVAAIVAAEGKGCMGIFIGLNAGEQHAEDDGESKTPDEALAVVVDERMVRPSDRRARGQQDESVEQREMPGIEDVMPFGGQAPPVTSRREA